MRNVSFFAFVAGILLMTCGAAGAATCQINDGATYTNSPVVRVQYNAGDREEVFRISNSPYFGSGEWRAVEGSGPDYVDWRLDSWNGKETVYMEFAEDSEGARLSTCQDSIIFDNKGPICLAFSSTVKCNQWGSFNYGTSDGYSSKVDITIRITTKSGATKRVFRDGWQRTGLRHWDWYVNLEKGTYRIVVTAGDLAGNAQSGTGRAWLRVR